MNIYIYFEMAIKIAGLVPKRKVGGNTPMFRPYVGI